MNKNETDDLILRNLPLIKKCIKDMYRNGSLYCNSEDEFESIYYNALIGMINGAKTYKPGVATEGTYLYTCIKNGIIRYIYSSNMQKRKLDKEEKISLDKNVLENESESGTLGDFIVDTKVDIEKEVEQKVLIEQIIQELSKMKKQSYAMIIKMRFGLDGFPEKNFEEIGKVFKISRQRAYQKYKLGMGNLKKALFEKENLSENKKYDKKNNKKF